jgi:predicted ribosomally synthesized peptide with SipW-like signal peptide
VIYLKKIISSLLGIALTLSIIGGVAYAAFSDTAAVEGVSFSAGDAELSVWDGDTYEDVFTSNWDFSGIYPGYTNSAQTFWLKNESTSPVTFAVAGQLRNGVDGNWEELKDNVEVAIVPTGTDPVEGDWFTLNEWNTTGDEIDTALDQNEEEQYTFHVRVLGSAPSTIEGTALSSVEFDFTGTQVIE